MSAEQPSLDDVRFDGRGLVPVVVAHAATGGLRMVAGADRAALDATLDTGYAHFHSRSRGRLWKKGEESGNVLAVSEVWLDCDGDTVLYRATPAGPTCHTGAETCFFRRVQPDAAPRSCETAPASVLEALDEVLSARAGTDPSASYTAGLLASSDDARAKVVEEARELCDAIESEGEAQVAHELADLVFHALVAAHARGVRSTDLAEELHRRFGVGGHAEKASR